MKKMKNKKTIIISLLAVTVAAAAAAFYFKTSTLTESNQNTSDKELVARNETPERRGWENKSNSISYALRKALPKTDFGGVWINNSGDGKVNIGLVEESPTAQKSRRIINDKIRAAKLTKGAVITPVKYSYTTLIQTRDAIHRLHMQNVEKGQWPIQVGIKTDINKVQVDIPKDRKHMTTGHYRVLAAIEEKYKDLVFFEYYNEIPRSD